MKHYELLCVLPGTLSEDEVNPLVQQVQEIIETNGGKELKIDDMGKSRLAYPMKHIRYGYFRMFTFEAEATDVNKIQAKLKLVSQLLRALVTTFDPSKRKEGERKIDASNFGKEIVHKDDKVQEKKEFKPKKKEVEIKKEDSVSKEEKIEKVVEEKSEKKAEEKPAVKKTTKKSEKKIDLEDIDAKLDKILESDLNSV
jgi:small subunit ribosomal protein S6